VWSPDRRRIAYGNGRDFLVADGDGSESRKIATLDGEASRIQWSPDQESLRFTMQNPSSITNSSSLWEISVTGTKLHPLLSGWNIPPRECCGIWTPNGKYFIFVSHKGGKDNLWVIREKGRGLHWHGGEPMPLTNLTLDSDNPVLSPDGKSIFFWLYSGICG